MVSKLSLSEKVQSRLSRSFHASRALRFVPKSLRFLFLEFPETFKLFSSCPSSFHLPEVSRLPFAGFLCYEIFMVRIPFGISSPALGELFYSISFQAVCQELFFLFFSPSRRSRGLSETACLYYQIPSSLSIPFPLFFDKPKSLDVITSNISK